jgi:TolB-like protein
MTRPITDAPPTLPNKPSIAVLAFTNKSGDAVDVFGDGISGGRIRTGHLCCDPKFISLTSRL